MDFVSPQKENGYTPIANELLEQIISFDFSKRQLVVIMAIARMTYGYNKKSDALSGWQIAQMTNLDRSHVSKTLKELHELNVITKHESGRQSHGVLVQEIAINKHYNEWLTVAKTATVAELATVAKTATVTVAKTATEPLPKQPTHKAIKTKNNILGSRLPKDWFLSEEYIKAAKSINGTLSKSQIEFIADGFKDYWHSLSGAKAVKLDWLATWRNWIRNQNIKPIQKIDEIPDWQKGMI